LPQLFFKRNNIYRSSNRKNEKGDWIYDKVPTHCPECKRIGEYRELIDTEEEFKNTKRTKLIDYSEDLLSQDEYKNKTRTELIDKVLNDNKLNSVKKLQKLWE